AGGEFVALDDIDYGMRATARGRLGLLVTLAGVRYVTVASRFMQHLAKNQSVRAEYVPLGVAIDQWPLREPCPRDPSRPLRLLHVGDIRPVKDQTLLVAAAGQMRDAGVAFELDVVGLDTMDGALQRTPDARRIESVTRWHGSLGRDALRRLMNRAD